MKSSTVLGSSMSRWGMEVTAGAVGLVALGVTVFMVVPQVVVVAAIPGPDPVASASPEPMTEPVLSTWEKSVAAYANPVSLPLYTHRVPAWERHLLSFGPVRDTEPVRKQASKPPVKDVAQRTRPVRTPVVANSANGVSANDFLPPLTVPTPTIPTPTIPTQTQTQTQTPTVATPTTTPTQTPGPSPEPGDIRVVHANIKAGMPANQFATNMNTVMASRPDFVTLNEVNQRSDAQITPTGYDSYRSMHSEFTKETPVLWRTDRWTSIVTGTRYLSHRQVKWGIRAVNWVTVKNNNTGRVVSLISAHPAPTMPRTRGLLPEFMSGLARLTNELGAKGLVFVGGDLNVHYQTPSWPTGILASAGLKATYDTFGRPPGGTGNQGGGATIDYVLYRQHEDLTPTAQGTYGLSSDHDAVWADFTITP